MIEFDRRMMHMLPRRLMVSGLAVVLVSSAATAQSPGTFEIGAFGQYSFMDKAWALQNGAGLGGRLGVYVAPRFLLEADIAATTLNGKAPRPGGSYSFRTYAGRLVYNLPVDGNEFLLSAGMGGENGDGATDFSLTPGIGYRWNLTKNIALRFDGLVEYVENPSDRLFQFLPAQAPGTSVVNSGAARSTNVELRVGLSFRFGGASEAAPPPPPPPPPPRINQDSIDAARRREAQAQADAAAAARARARQDSIDAAARARQNAIDAANRAAAEAAARLRATLEAKIFFDLDKSELRDDAKALLDAKIPIMQANPNVRIRIEGNADERGSDEYNQALGMRRAQQAKRYLLSKGIADARIDIASNGEEKPVCTSHEESCWSQNRRNEFVIVAGGDNLMPPR
jgi:peptidoglycan-associated lipoprotein